MSYLPSGSPRPHRAGPTALVPVLARRSTAAWTVLLLAIAMLGLAAVAPAADAADRNFAPRFTTNDTGDIDIFGNTLMTCPANASGCAAAQQAGVTTTADSSSQNNAYNMQYIDVDGDSSTFNSSRATVSLPSGSTVLLAGLYWGARTAAGSGGSAARDAAARNRVKLRAPGAAGYTTLTAETLDDGTGGIYQGFEDVTSIVKGAGAGVYTVADVQAATGADTLAGWSLVIAYRDTAQPARNLSIFDGIKSISSGASGSILVSGFTTPPAGPVNSTIGFVNYEGDGGLVGDSAQLNGRTLSDAQHPASNFFNSRSSRNGVRRTATDPNYPNQLGIEQSMLTVGKPFINNNDTSATIGLTSSGDVYAPGVVTLATELYAPKIEQSKAVTDLNGGSVEQGDVLRYTITGKNTGQDGAADFVLRDPIPANTSYKPGSLSLTQPGGTAAGATDATDGDKGEYDGGNRRVVARFGTGSSATAGGTIPVDGTYIATFEVVVGGPSPAIAADTVITNLATASFTSQSLRTPLTAESTATASVKTPDLTITKTGAGTPSAGQDYDYEVTVRNAGAVKTQGTVAVTDTLPAGLTPRTATPAEGTGWSCTVNGQTFTCTRASLLGAGESYPPITLRTTVSSNPPASIVNTASVAGGGDGNLTNNTGSSTNTPARPADLSVMKAANATSVAVGGNVSYTLTVKNNGTADSTGGIVTDTLPAGLLFVSATPPSGVAGASCGTPSAAGVLSCSVGPLSSGTERVFTVVAKPAVGTAGATLRNTAAVSGNELDPTPGNNGSSAQIDVKPVDLAITSSIQGDPATFSPNTTYTWLVGVKNEGGSEAPNSNVRFPVPTGTTVATTGLDTRCRVVGTGADQVVTCDLTTIAPDGGTGTSPLRIPLTTVSSPPSTIDTTVTVSTSESETNLGNNTAVTTTPVVSAVDLGVTLTTDPGSTSAGDTLTLKAVVTNNGPGTPQTPTLTIPVPAGTTFVSADDGCTLQGTNAVCQLTSSDLGPGESVTKSIKVKVGDDPGAAVSATATVTAPNDTDPTNDTASVAVPVVRTAGLSIEKTASTTQAKPGETVVYTLTAKNAGPAAAQDTVITDLLPSGTTFVSADAPCAVQAGKVTCEVGTVPAGQSRSFAVRVTVDPITSALDPNARMDLTVDKAETPFTIAKNGTSTVAAQCPAGWIATDGSVVLDSTDQGKGSFSDVDVLSSVSTVDGRGWTGTIRNTTDGELKGKVYAVCMNGTVSGGGHSHQLLVSDPVTAVRTTGQHDDVVVSCGPGRVPVAPGWTFTDGAGRVTGSVPDGSEWRFRVDARRAAGVRLQVRCLSTTTSVTNGHAHDLELRQLDETVDVRRSQSTNDVVKELRLQCGSDKGIVGGVSYDPGLVSLGTLPQPVNRDYYFYNPTNGTLKARITLLCLGIRTGGELPVADVANTASIRTSTADASTADDTSSVTFRATPASGPVDPAPAPAVQADPSPAPLAASPAPASPPAAPAAPVAPAASAKASILSSALRVTGSTSRATVAVPVRCAKACTGTAKLVATSALRSAGIKKGAVLATALVKLTAGKKSTLRLVAKGKVAKALKRGGVKRAKLVVSTGKGKQVTKTVRLVLK